MGLVFVLLLGEIDLSAGFAAGMGAAILGVTLTQGLGVAARVLVALLDRRRHRPRDRAARRAARASRASSSRSRPSSPCRACAADHRRGRHHPDPRRRRPRADEREHAGRPRLAVRDRSSSAATRRRRSLACRGAARPGLPTRPMPCWAAKVAALAVLVLVGGLPPQPGAPARRRRDHRSRACPGSCRSSSCSSWC